jgi:glucan phosphoethanolaminetransferase (alkaline phosphatase superfamily)
MCKYIVISLALLINALISIFSDEKILIEEVILGTIILASYYLFVSRLYLHQKKIWYAIFLYMSILILTVPQTIGVLSITLFNCFFSYGQASSLLNTNLSESFSMLSSFPAIGGVFIFFIVFNFYIVKTFVNIKLKKVLIYFLVSLWMILPLVSVAFKWYKNIGGESEFSYFFRNSTFSKYRTLILAYEPSKDLRALKSTRPKYSNISYLDNGIETIVLVIGESARRQNMSLYSYERNTTPYQDAEVHNMKKYNNMISSAGITLLSVPLLLSCVPPQEFVKNKMLISDNVINLSSRLGFKTYWLSTQEEGSHYVSAVSNMASLADSSRWFTGYDEVLIDPVRDIVNNMKAHKKLIILHINGSHSNACDKFPTAFSYFKGKNEAVDCYDNSVRYTDHILGKLFEHFRNGNSAIIYLSDHGEKFINNRYIHADHKEATTIPYYIWYGNGVPESLKDVRSIDDLFSLEVNYYEIAKLLGVSNLHFVKSSPVQFLKSNLEIIDYQNLEE